MRSSIYLSSASNNQRPQAIGILIAITVLWGFTYPMAQFGAKNMPSSWFMLLRFGSAFGVLLLLARRSLFSKVLWQWRNWRALALTAIVGLANFVGFVGQTIGLETTTSGKAAFIIGLSVVFVPILATSFRKTRSGKSWASVGISALGLVCLMGQRLSFDVVIGDAWMLLAALAFTVQIVLTEHLSREIDVMALIAIQVGVCVMGNLAWVALDHPQLPMISMGTLGIAVYLGVVTTAFALAIQTWAQRHISATEATLIICSEPLWAATAGVALFAERYTGLGLFGCFLISLSMIWPCCKAFSLRHLGKQIPCHSNVNF